MKRIPFLFTILSVITLGSYGQTPEQLKAWLPKVDNWTLSETTEVFDEDNLFDRINGAAPLFIENNFQEMTALEYTSGDDYITIQLYRHATPEDAFGMYASERSSDLSFLPVGGEGQGDSKNIYFFSGSVYVKMWSNTEKAEKALRNIAEVLAVKIDQNAAYPVAVKAFPAENQIPYSIAYITSNYIGHEFLEAVYTSKYDLGGQTVQAFIIDGKTPVGARDILNKYFTFTKQLLDFQEGDIIIKDRYNGDIPVVWKDRYIVGVFDENGNEIIQSDKLIKAIVANL